MLFDREAFVSSQNSHFQFHIIIAAPQRHIKHAFAADVEVVAVDQRNGAVGLLHQNRPYSMGRRRTTPATPLYLGRLCDRDCSIAKLRLWWSKKGCRDSGASMDTSLIRSPWISMVSPSITLACPAILLAKPGPAIVQHSAATAKNLFILGFLPRNGSVSL